MPILSLVLKIGISLFLGCCSVTATGLYVLQDNYEGPSFFDEFDFFTQPDPTHGFVQYVDATTARNSGLISSSANSTYIGVDHTNVYPILGPGRPSVRIKSKKSYSHGLFIADITHMPGGVCGTWPAFWTVGPDWPNNGEIDIFEGVNQAKNNLMSMHTSENCTVAGSGETGTLVTNDCFVNAAGQPGNSGCGVTSAYTDSYGTGFNNGQGGVYATEWTSDAIKIWFFPRGSIPASIGAGVPDTTTFGTPAANFQGSCDIDSHFADQQIVRFRPRQEAQLAFVENANKEQVFDTTFCGDYAGNVWTSGSCSTRAATCVEYVANNPSAFTDVFWSINSLKVFQQLIATASSSSSYLSSVTPVASTSSISAVPVGMGRTSTTSSEGASTSILVGGGPPDASINTDNSTSSVALSSELSTTVDVAKSSMVTSFIEPGISINFSIPSTISSVSNPGTIIAVSRDLNVSTAILSVDTLLTSSSLMRTATAASAIETPTVRLCRRRPHKQQRSALPDPAASSSDHLQAEQS